MSVATRVAEEMHGAVGGLVGYKVRFDDKTSHDTHIKFLTDGMLVREAVADPLLSRYNVLMLDEAHERSVSTDVLLGLVRTLLPKRPELRVLVTSATLDTDKFVQYFGADTPVVSVPGRSHPVAVFHSKTDNASASGATMDAAVDVVMRIHSREDQGDVLVFLTGQEEIDRTVDALTLRAGDIGAAPDLHTWQYDAHARAWRRSHSKHTPHPMDAAGGRPAKLLPLPLYGALSSDLQQRVFAPAPPGHRKVVIATNIAETSVTVDGIRYVVDPGFVKEKSFDFVRGMEALNVVPISQNAAQQRAGRAGRTGPGKCYRLFSKPSYLAAPVETVPEIKRTNLTNVVLLLKALGVQDVLDFPFLDAPAPSAIASGLKQLYLLGALDADGCITGIGRELTHFPLLPPLARMLVEATKVDVLPEALTLAAVLGSESLYWNPPRAAPASTAVRGSHHGASARTSQDMAVLGARAEMYDESGDHVTLVQVYEEWRRQGGSPDWARSKFLNMRGLRQAHRTRQQLAELASSHTPGGRLDEWGRSLPGPDRYGTGIGNGTGMTDGADGRDESVGDLRRPLASREHPRSLQTPAAPWVCAGDTYKLITGSHGGTGVGEDGIALDRALLDDHREERYRRSTSDSALGTQLVFLHPTSALTVVSPPPFVLFHELVSTSRPYMRTVSAVKSKYLEVGSLTQQWLDRGQAMRLSLKVSSTSQPPILPARGRVWKRALLHQLTLLMPQWGRVWKPPERGLWRERKLALAQNETASH
ncbi:dhx8 [Symbiodinium sp. KB8]|nr:dhx8 [Symbiodinium sp. KB8]